MSNLERRLEKLERAVRAAWRHPRIIWSEGPHDDGSAEIARRIVEGTACSDDDFIIIRWLAPGEDGTMTEARKEKNELERDRAARSGLEGRQQPPRPRHCVQVIYDPRDGSPYPDEAAEFAKLIEVGTAKPGDDFLLIVREIVDPVSPGVRRRE